MCRFSSRSSLLAGVSAVVLAASVGSGAFAQAVDYTYDSSGNIDAWADGTERTGNSGNDIANARAGDNLTLSAGRVLMTPSSRSGASIGILRSGAGSAGRFLLADGRSSAGTLTGRIGKIQKQGSQAVDLYVQNFGRSGSVVEVIVAGDAVVDELTINMTVAHPNGSKGRATFGGDLTIENNATLDDVGTAGDSRAYLVFNGSADQRILGSGPAKITAAADGEGTIQVLNGVNNAAPRKATFDIEIGANDRRLRQLTVGDSSKGGHAIFNRGVHVDNIDVIAGNHTNEQTIVEFRGDVSGETIKLTDGRHVVGTSARIVNAGAIFNASAGDITVGNKIVGGRSNGTSRGGDLTIIGGRSSGGSARNKVTFNNRVGAGNGRLTSIFVGSNESAGVAVFREDIDAGFIYISGGTTADEASHVTIEKSSTIKYSGSITISNNATLTIGGTGRSATVNDTGQTIRGWIEAGGDGQGTLIVDNRGDAGTGRTSNNTVTFSSSVGYDGQALKQITLDDGQTVFEGAVYAGTITVNSADGTTFNGAISATTFKFGASATANSRVTFAGTAAQTITPAITTDANNQGAITIANRAGVTFEGNLGTDAARLARLTLDTGTKATLEQSGYLASNVTIGNGATLIVGDASGVTGTNGRGTGVRDAQTITGNIVAGDDGQGNLEIRNRSGHATGRKVSFTGSIGADGRALNRITVADGETTFNGDVYAGNLTITARDATTFRGHVKADREFELGNGSFVTFGGTAGQRITGDITSAAGGNYGTIIIDNTHADGVTFGGQLGASGHGLRSLTVNEGAKVTFTRPVYLSGTLRLKTGTTIALGDGLTRRDDATRAFVTVGDYAFEGDFTEANRVRLILPLSLTSGTQKVFSAHDTLDEEKFSFAGNNLVNYSYDFDDDGTDVTVKEKGSDAGDEGNQGDGSGDTDVKVADKDADKDAGDEGNQGDGSGGDDTDVAGKDKDADKGDVSKDSDVADKGDKSEGDGSGGDGPDVKEVAGKDKDADRDVPLNLKSGGDGSGSDDTDVKDVAGKDVDDKDADRDVDVADKGLSRPIALMTPNAVGFKSAGEVSSKLGVSPSEATVLLAAADVAKDLPANDPVKKILEEATRAGNEAQVRRLAAQLTPQMTALVGVRRAVLSTGRQVAGLLSDRLALQRGGDSRSGFVQSGFATGGEGLDRAFWLKPFGSRGKQAKDKKQNIDGYRTSARGLAVGVDAPVGERGRVGTALAYSTSRMTGKGVGEDKTDVRSWQVSVYGDYSTGRYYVDGQVGVGRNDVSTTSRVAGLRRKSAYDTTSLTASVGGGVPINLDATTTLTPTAGLSWTRVGSAKYTTTGSLSLNQKIKVKSIDAVVGTLGTRLHKEITRGNGTLVPVARVGLSYDFAGDQTTARGQFTGGGSRFTVKGAKVKKLSGTAGVGLSYNAPRWSIGADYDLSARPGYTGHSARLNARVKF